MKRCIALATFINMRWLFFFVLFCVSAPSNAALQLDENGCRNYAIWARDIVWAKSVGADKEKVMASLMEFREGTNAPVFTLVSRYFDMLWDTGMPWQFVGTAVYSECVERRGKYGDET